MTPTHVFVEDIPRRKFLEIGARGGIALAATPSLLNTLLASTRSGDVQLPTLELDKTMLDRVIRKALERGGEFADVYVENRVSRDILMEESKFKRASFGISQGAGVRVILGDKTGYAYTDEFTEEKLMRAAEIASYVARGGQASKPVSVR